MNDLREIVFGWYALVFGWGLFIALLSLVGLLVRRCLPAEVPDWFAGWHCGCEFRRILSIGFFCICVAVGAIKPDGVLTNGSVLQMPPSAASVVVAADPHLGEKIPTRSWNVAGAWKYQLRKQAFADGFVFPFGSNHLDRVYVSSQGSVRESRFSTNVIASLGVPLAVVPGLTECSHTHTVSNTYLFSWENAAVNRDTNTLFSGSIELKRNGSITITTNGVTRTIERELPFAHDGYGQDDDWVRANFTNAEKIISVGYANWVDAQVGVGKLNGLYKLTATVTEKPPECINLHIGDYSVAVTNAGEYVFLLGKGFRYGIDVFPRSFTNLSFTASDDLGVNMRMARLANVGDNNGHWTEDHGALEMYFSGAMFPYAPPGHVCWRPSLTVSPWNWQPSELNEEETFTACVTDVPWFASPVYQWSTADSDVVSIDSPNDQTTRMQCHFPKAHEVRPSLSLEVTFPGCSLHSYYSFDSGGEASDGVSLTFEIPEAFFNNADDDNDDGKNDYEPPVDSGDDDVGYGKLVFRSPYATNGVVAVEGAWGYDPGFSDYGLLYSDRECTRKITGKTEFNVENGQSLTIPLYFNAVNASDSYPGVQVKARWRPERGDDFVASGYTTIVSPDVEPICNETTNVVVDGVAHNFVVNPCGVGIGREAYFRIKVRPESFPDEKIVWQADGGIEFVGGNAGRAVTVRGVAPGPASLQIRMRSGDYGLPEFPLYVTACTNIPIHAVIVRDEDKIAQSTNRISEMVSVANDIYAQVGMSFYLASVCVTNLPNAYTITLKDEGDEMWSHGRLTALKSETGGIECYFVDSIVDSQGDPVDILGATSSSGIVLVRVAYDSVLAHEIGHLCDVRDIYEKDEEGTLTLLADKASWRHMPADWNGGCLGHGAAGTRYYRYGTGMTEIVSRMLMNGLKGKDDRHYDMTLGPVYGIKVVDPEQYEKGDVAVGFLGESGFKVPFCK